MGARKDKSIIRDILDGRSSAFEELVERYRSMVYTIAVRITKSEEDAEEVTQDAFMKAFRSLEKFGGRSKFSTWLYRIAYNEAVSRTRRNKGNDVSVDDEEAQVPEIEETRTAMDKLNVSDRRACLEKAMEKLDEEEATIVTLYYIEEKKVGDIAKVTGSTKSKIKVKLHRARKRLYAGLDRNLKEEMKNLIP